MNKKKTRSPGEFSQIIIQGLTLWLTGGTIFWFTELLAVLIGLPHSWAYKKFLSAGVSSSEAIFSILSFGEISIAFISYILMSFIGGVICAIVIYLLTRNGDEVRINALLIAVYIASHFFIFIGFWLNTKYLPALLSVKSILSNMILLLMCIALAHICFKRFVHIKPERVFSVFMSLVFAMYAFLLGNLLVLKIFEARLVSLKGIILSISFAAVCLALYFVLQRGFQLRRFRNLNLYSARKLVFSTVGALAVCTGLIILITELPSIFVSDGKLNKSGDKPNVLFIVMDTTRSDRLSCYGNNRTTSPHIDQIAGEGILFGNAVSPSGWTLPSHVSMFTGLLPFEYSTGHISPYLSKEVDTLATILKENGYNTLGYSNNPWISFFTGLSRGFDDFLVGWKKDEGRYFYKVIYDTLSEFSMRNNPDWTIKDHGAARTTRYVSQWIEKNSTAPFFVFINYMEPHLPYNPPPPYDLLYKPDDISSRELKNLAPNPEDVKTLMVPCRRSQKELSAIRALYDGEINYLDGKIWDLYKTLKTLNILDNTLLIITSDHGDNLGEHGIIGHAYGLFNTLIYVPLIIRYPKDFSPGSVINSFVQTTDVFYTIMDIAGIKRYPSGLGISKSLVKRINGQGYQNILVAEHDTPINNLNWARKEGINVDHLDKGLRTVISDRYKYIETSKGEEELFDLSQDPEELKNIIENKEIASAMRNKLLEITNKAKRTAAAKNIPKMDQETRDRLKSLGYAK